MLTIASRRLALTPKSLRRRCSPPQPDVILAFSTPVTAAFQRETRTVPIVFIGIADAVGQGFVPSLTHPGGNLTGLTMYEASVTGKWLEMLKEIEPQLARAAFVVSPQ